LQGGEGLEIGRLEDLKIGRFEDWEMVKLKYESNDIYRERV